MKNRFNKLIISIICIIFIVNTSVLQAQKLNLTKPEDNLKAFVKMRASLKEGEEVVYYWTGTIYSFVPGERSKELFGMEAYSIAKTKKTLTGYEMTTREVALYTDLETGQYLKRWYNPLIKDTVDVLHVWNDPVNQTFNLKSKYGDWGVPTTKLGADRVCFNSDIFLLYPSPLKVAEYPENSRSDNYQACELFQFFCSEKELNNKKNSAYAEISWSRMSDYLPWMRMSSKPGYLVYQCRGHKIMNGAFEALPQRVQDYVKSNQPVFMHAPDTYVTPNMTSWKYYKQLFPKGK